ATPPALARVLERGDDDALDAFARVQLLLRGYLVRRASLHESARAAVCALRVLSEDDEVYVFGRAVAQRCEARVEQSHGAQVYVKVEAAPHAEQNVFGVLVRRDARVAERAREYRVELAREHF